MIEDDRASNKYLHFEISLTTIDNMVYTITSLDDFITLDNWYDEIRCVNISLRYCKKRISYLYYYIVFDDFFRKLTFCYSTTLYNLSNSVFIRFIERLGYSYNDQIKITPYYPYNNENVLYSDEEVFLA